MNQNLRISSNVAPSNPTSCLRPLARAVRPVIEAVERRVLLSSVALDPSFNSKGYVLDTASPAVGAATAYNAISHDVIVAGERKGAAEHVELTAFKSSGALDSSFGVGGTATSTAPGECRRVVVQSDGKILVVSATINYAWYLSRYTLTGALDHSFGNGGIVPFNSFIPSAANVRLLANGDIILGGQSGYGSASPKAALIAYTNAGKLDASFGNGGVAAAVAGGFGDIAVDSAGRIVAVGATSPTAASPAGSLSAGLLERFTSAGGLDLSFGAGGSKVIANVSGFSAVTLQSTGTIATFGEIRATAGNFWQLNHFTAKGAVDTSFGSGGQGYVRTTVGGQPTFQPDGKVLIAGSVSTGIGGITSPTLARLNVNGSLDSSFGAGGYAKFGLAYIGNQCAAGLSLQPDGKVLLSSAGPNSGPFTGLDMSPTRLNANGTPDTTFGPYGTAVGRPWFSSGQVLAVLPDNQTLVAGQVVVAGEAGIYVRRYKANGSVDPTFAPGRGLAGQSGYIFLGPVVGASLYGGPAPLRLCVDPQGRILVGVAPGGFPQVGVGIVRLTPSGAMDTTFGVNGTAAISELGNFLLQPNGQILASTGRDVTRLTKNGQPDLSFGGGASVSVPIFHTPDGPLAVQADGKILVGGSMMVQIPADGGFINNTDLAVVRLNSDGSLDTTFGTGGVATADFFQFDGGVSYPGYSDAATATALVVRPNGSIVAAGVTQQENTTLYGENRGTAAQFLPNGTLDPAFGAGGKLQPFGPSTFKGTTVTNVFLQSDGSLVFTGTVTDFGYATFYVNDVFTQFPPSGSYAPTNGVYDALLDAAAAPNGALVVIGSARGATGTGFVLARYLLQAGSIRGTVFNDLNANGNPETTEPKVAGRTVYIDTNNNGKLDSGEIRTITNAAGGFTFGSLRAGTYNIREVLPAGWRQTAPNGNTAARVVKLSVGQDVTIMQIGATQAAVITGKFYNDLNSNGVLDTGESGLAYWQVYVDKNNNGVWDKGEYIVTADSRGNYTMVLKPGTYRLREVRRNGWTRTQPAGAWPLGYYDVTVAAGQLVTARNFGNRL